MTEILYPWGYQKLLVPMNRLKELARIDLMEPKFAECLFAYIESKGGTHGIGGAVRFVQPDKNGFAPPGKSFHQLQRFRDNTEYFMAVDIVVRNGNNVHRAPRWDEVPRQDSGHPDIFVYGVHANVPGEPWHIQFFKVDGWQSWVNAGRNRCDPNFKPKSSKPSAPQPTPAPAPQEPKEYKPGERTLKLTTPNMRGGDVKYLQQVIKELGQPISTDGVFGPQTEIQVKTVQSWVKLAQDGIVGPKTWKVIIDADKTKVPAPAPTPPKPAPTPTHSPGSRTLKLASPTMYGDDVRFVQNVIRKQGIGISVDGYYGKSTRDKVKILQGWNKLEQDGVVGPKTWAVIKKY